MENMTDGAERLMDCQEIERIVWTEGPEAAPKAHLVDCTSCSEEVRRAGDLRAALQGMRVRYAMPSEDLEVSILASATRSRLDRVRDITAHPKFWRGAAVGAAAAAGVATAAIGVLVARRRARPVADVA